MKLVAKLWSVLGSVATLAVFAGCEAQVAGPKSAGGGEPRVKAKITREESPRPGALPDFGQWNVTESDRPGESVAWRWDRNAGRFKATWPDGTVAELTVVKLGATEIALQRSDVAGPRPGLTARYAGFLVPGISGEPLHAHLQGNVTWTWQGRETTGTWQAVSPHGRHLSLEAR